MQQKLVTPEELGARWDLHKSTVLRMYHAGVIPGITLCRGKKRSIIRFRLSAIEAFERQREQENG